MRPEQAVDWGGTCAGASGRACVADGGRASIAVYRSKAHRNRVNAKILKDPRIAAMPPESMPFDVKRMAYGGFEVIVSA